MVGEYGSGTLLHEGKKADTETEKSQGQDTKNLILIIYILQPSFTS